MYKWFILEGRILLMHILYQIHLRSLHAMSGTMFGYVCWCILCGKKICLISCLCEHLRHASTPQNIKLVVSCCLIIRYITNYWNVSDNEKKGMVANIQQQLIHLHISLSLQMFSLFNCTLNCGPQAVKMPWISGVRHLVESTEKLTYKYNVHFGGAMSQAVFLLRWSRENEYYKLLWNSNSRVKMGCSGRKDGSKLVLMSNPESNFTVS